MMEVYKQYTSGREVFQPWHHDPDIGDLMHHLEVCGSMSLVDWDRMWTLKWASLQTLPLPGEVWELGVYRGGSALLMKRLIEKYGPGPDQEVALRLFDSFEGLPATAEGIDLHHKGDFGDTSLEEVQALVGVETFIDYRKGWIPQGFIGLEDSRVRFAHIDLDIYRPILDTLEFVYPRLARGGVIVFDDYGFDSCPGARQAVDEFCSDKREPPLSLPTGQAILVKSA
jgi:O-methyltransferase